MWEGLGYYRRARSLLACSKLLVNKYQLKLPKTLEEIKKVCPGVIAEGPENHEENEGSNKDLVWGNYFDLY